MSNKYDDGESRLNEYEVVKKIGNGRFGEVFLVKHKKTQEFFCWKAISYRGLKEREKSQLVIEVNVMRELKHKNIVRYIDRFLNKANQKLYILMEFCDAGDLSRNIQKCYKMFGKIEEHAVLDITRQLLHALAYCHNLKDGPNGERVLHRDLKPQNIFLSTGIRHIGKITAQANNLTSRPIAKIGDFGLSKNIGIESMAHSCVGTPYYWSPELLLHETKSYDDKSDMWALGCIIYELCSGKTPFHKANNFAQLVSELKKGPELPIKGKSKELNMLIQSLLHLSPKERPSALQCLGFQIIKQISPPVNRKESITDQVKRESAARMEGGPYSPSSQSSVINKRTDERERSSSRISRQGISDVNKDVAKYTREVPKSHYRVNGQYAVDGGQMYNVEKERMEEKKKMKREMLEKEQMERNRTEEESVHQKAVEMKNMEQKRIDRGKLERLERERIERMGRERMERLEIERKEIERERLSRERLERERIERERLERERLARDRIERERLGRDRIERERSDRDRIERERSERGRIERARLERLEREHTNRGERLEKDRLDKERAERDGIDRFEREKVEKERREQYYMREAQDNRKLEAIEKMRLHSKNSENYNSPRVKEKYEQVTKMKIYPYDTNDRTNVRSNTKHGLYTDEDDDHNIPVVVEKRDRDRESYLRSHSASSITSKQMPKYKNAPLPSPTPTSKNYYPRENMYNIPVSPTNRSQYSNTSADNPPYKNIIRDQRNIGTVSAAADVLKNPKEVYKESSSNIPYKGSKYDREFLDKGYMEEGGNGCKSSRVSNMYFNENARRSSSVMTQANGNVSRNRSGTVVRPNIEYEKGNVEESRAFKNLEKDREYLLEKKKLLLEKEKELYARIKPTGTYDYPPVQRRDRYEHIKALDKNNVQNNRRNTSVSVNRVVSENRNSYGIKNEPLARNEEYFMMKNRNVYDTQKAGRNEKYESGAYTCR